MSKHNLEIIIITYNRAKNLDNTLLQIVHSPIKDHHIKILDNCSDDNTYEVCKKYMGKLKNLKYVRHKRNIGGNGNIARAFEISSKEYVWVMCDDDNFYWQDWDEIEKAMEQKPDAIFLTNFQDSEANRVYHASGTYMCLYKTSNITSNSIDMMLNNIPNMFPHTALYIDILNRGGKIVHPHKTIVTAGQANWGGETYLRGLKKQEVTCYKKNMFWFVGYMNTLSLIRDKKLRNNIIDNTKHCCSSFFELLTHKLWMNRTMYKNSFMNIRTIFYALNLKWRILFFFCYFFAFLKSLVSTANIPDTPEKWVEVFKKKNTIKRVEKIRGKHNFLCLYGTGMMTEALNKIYDIRKFNYVSDIKYSTHSEYKGVDAIPPEMIQYFGFSAILVSVYRFEEVKKQLREMGVKCPIVRLV